MEDGIIFSESSIRNEVGYMDLTAEIRDNEFVISAENHNGYDWEAKCSVEEVVDCLVSLIGADRLLEMVNGIQK